MDSRSQDLWSIAASELSVEYGSIEFHSSEKLEILSQVQELTTQSLQQCVEKSWRYTRKNGETIIFRDLFNKILNWIEIFKKIGDAAAQYDPVHFSLPWAGVRFLLEIALKDCAKYSFVIEGASVVAESICRYAIFEEIYLQSTSKGVDELKKALVRIYTAILIYLLEAKKYFSERWAKRVVTSGLHMKSDLSVEYQAIITAQDAVDYCAKSVYMEGQNNIQRLLLEIDRPLKRLSDEFKNVKDNLESSKRVQILRWISPEPHEQYHEQSKRDIIPGTGQWLLSDRTFLQWKKESVSSILWLHGIPGSGKSKLTSIVIEEAFEASRGGDSPPPAYFYCSRNTAEPTRSRPDAILASIARQLASVGPGLSILPPAISVFKKKEAEGFVSGSLRLEESRQLILQLTERYQLTTIVIDALDESDPAQRVDLLNMLEAILRDSLGLVKIFISSRDDGDIVYKLKSYPHLELNSTRNRFDIATFVNAETKRLLEAGKLLAYSPEKEKLTKLIIAKVIKGADGMFRWASMQLQFLCMLEMDYDIKIRLLQIPPQLEVLYSEIYAKLTTFLGEARSHIIKNVFTWLLCAQRKFTAAEFLTIVSVTSAKHYGRVSKDQILKMCSNFVVFDAPLDTFRFAHLSVREFLEKQPEYCRESINQLAAETCLQALISTPKPLVSAYATFYWAIHSKLARGDGFSNGLRGLIFQFLSGENDPTSPFAMWTTLFQKLVDERATGWTVHYKYNDTMGLSHRTLLIACVFDFVEVVQDRIAKGSFHPNIKNKDGDSLLSISIANDSPNVTTVLLDAGLPITSEALKVAAGRFEKGKLVIGLLLEQNTTFEITEAVIKRVFDKQVILLLLQEHQKEFLVTTEIFRIIAERFDKDVMTLLLCWRGRTITITVEIVCAAARNTRHGLEVMKVLLEKRGSQFNISREVIMAAAKNTSSGPAVLGLLLRQRRQEIEITDAVLETAVTYWYSHGIKFLLKKLRQPLEITQNILKKAARNEFDGTSVIKLFLGNSENRFEIAEEVIIAAAKNSEDGENLIDMLLKEYSGHFKVTESCVEAAARSWHGNKKMKMLLEKAGGEFEISERVLVAAASGWDSYETFRLLLDKCPVEIKITDNVLVAAIENEEEDPEQIVELLLRECRFQNEVSEQVVTAVAESWNAEKLIILLFKKWENSLLVTEKVLEAAAANESSKGILILLWTRADENLKVTEGILQAAAGNEVYGLELMNFLLAHCPIQSIITEKVLKAAAANEKLGKELLKLLLEYSGAVVSDAVVATAAANGLEDVLQSLEDWNYIESWRQQWFAVSSFYNAAKNGDAETIMRLLARDLNPDLDYRGSKSPLWIASWNRHFEVVDLLLKTNIVDVNRESPDGRSPLFCAVERNSDAIALLLLENGANPKLSNCKGVTPMELVEQDENFEMEDIFEKYT